MDSTAQVSWAEKGHESQSPVVDDWNSTPGDFLLFYHAISLLQAGRKGLTYHLFKQIR